MEVPLPTHIICQAGTLLAASATTDVSNAIEILAGAKAGVCPALGTAHVDDRVSDDALGLLPFVEQVRVCVRVR